MNFFNPWAFGFLALVPVIVALYLMKLKRWPVPVSTLMFWQRIIEDHRQRAWFQRLRRWFSLLLHLLIFTCILLALANPSVDRAVRSRSSTVLILDNRARMQAIEPDGESRMRRAIRIAGGIVRQASPLRPMALLTTAGAPTVSVPFEEDESLLRKAVETTQSTDAGGDMAAALQLASAILSSRSGEKHILLVTDRPLDRPTATSGIDLKVIPVGTALDNLAITQFATRPVPANPETAEIFLRVRNFGHATATGNIEVKLDDHLLDVKPFRLAPGQESVEIFPALPRAKSTPNAGEAGPGWLTARLDFHDALAADNIAYALLPQLVPRHILLVSKGNWFLEKLLETDTAIRFELLTPESFQPGMEGQFDATIFDDYLPTQFDLARASGNLFFLKQTPFAISGPAIPRPIVTDLDTAHPALRMVSMEHVSLAPALPTSLPPHPPGGWTLEAPLRSFDHPLLITGTRQTPSGTQRLAALAIDLAESDLPLRVSFPLLMSNTIHWLAGAPPATRLTSKAGEPAPLSDGESIDSAPTTSPAPGTSSTNQPPALASGTPLLNGFYRIHRPDASAWLAVNTFSEEESNLRKPSRSPKANYASSLNHLFAPSAAWTLREIFALAALLLFTVEWRLFHRRKTE